MGESTPCAVQGGIKWRWALVFWATQLISQTVFRQMLLWIERKVDWVRDRATLAHRFDDGSIESDGRLQIMNATERPQSPVVSEQFTCMVPR